MKISTYLKKFKNFKYAVAGILHALRSDVGYQWQFISITSGIVVFIFIFKPLTQVEYLFLGLAWTLILTTELQNSAFETALDRIHPRKHDEIGKSKDMAAGSVLTTGFFLVFVMVMIVFL